MAVLFFPFDLLSHYLRCLQLAEALGDCHAIVFPDSPRYGAFVRARGFHTEPCLDLDAESVVLQTARLRFGWLQKNELERVFRAQVDLIERWRPAFVVGDMSHTLRMAAEFTGTPFVSVINGYFSPYYAERRALPSAFPRTLQAVLPGSWLRTLAPWGEAATFWHIHRPYRALRRKYRLPMTFSYVDEFVGDLTCVADSPALFPQRQLPDDFTVIGPLYHRGGEPEPGVRSFLQRRATGSSTPRITVVVQMGSTGALERLALLNDAEAFGAFNLIIAGDTDGRFAGPHIYAAPFLNLSDVLPLADVALCHGGNGAINQILAAGLPVICLPAYFEQEWNATRIEALGLGQMLREVPAAEVLSRLFRRWSSLKGQPPFADLPQALDLDATQKRFVKATERWTG